MSSEPFLRRLRIKNFRSIGKCDVELRPFTILVGRNGAGKSNVLDAIRFVMESLQSSLDHAIKSRGGLDEVRRRSTGHPRNFAIQLELQLQDHRVSYGFEVAAKGERGFVVKQESLSYPLGSYRVLEGEIEHATSPTMPPASAEPLPGERSGAP